MTLDYPSSSPPYDTVTEEIQSPVISGNPYGCITVKFSRARFCAIDEWTCESCGAYVGERNRKLHAHYHRVQKDEKEQLETLILKVNSTIEPSTNNLASRLQRLEVDQPYLRLELDKQNKVIEAVKKEYPA